MLSGAIEQLTANVFPHFNLFNKLKHLYIGSENMFDHIVRNYVYPSYIVAVKHKFRQKVVETFEHIYQGEEFCDCEACREGWKSRYWERRTWLCTEGYWYSRDFAAALRIYLQTEDTDLRTAYDWVSTNPRKDLSYKHTVRDFMKLLSKSRWHCRGHTKKSRSWQCEKTHKTITTNCCGSSDTTGKGYCKIHLK